MKVFAPVFFILVVCAASSNSFAITNSTVQEKAVENTDDGNGKNETVSQIDSTNVRANDTERLPVDSKHIWGLLQRLEALETKLEDVAQESELCTEINSQQDDDIAALQAQKNQVVAFSAYLSKGVHVSHGDPVLFDNIVTNLGGGYTEICGIFKAPVHGLYLFTLHFITSSQTLVSTNLDIMVNGSRRCIGYGDKDHRHTTGVCSVLVELFPGDRVHVQSEDPHDDGGAVYGGFYTMLSGHLVNAL